MDLCSEMLLAHLRAGQAGRFRLSRVCPPFRRRLSRLLPGRRWGANADRLLNRHWDYPRHLRRRVGEFDLFHLSDHSYAHPVHVLPGRRTGVLCHDLDAFCCLLEPRREPRPRWFRQVARRILTGLQKAAVVFHVSALTGRLIREHGLVEPGRLVYAPNGVAPDFTADENDDHPEAEILSPFGGRPFLLHVGKCVPRKRIDVLLDVFAGVRESWPELLLVQVGGPWTPAQQEQIGRLGVAGSLVQVRDLARETIAGLYRRAALVLQPSEAEGFGLPVVEALACGAVVVASDIPALREVGDEAAVYCPVADVATWVDTVCRLLRCSDSAPRRSARLAHASRYSWSAQAEIIAAAYERLLRPT